MHVNPCARRRAGRHGEFLQSGDGGLKGGSIIASKSADIIRAEDGDEEVEFTAIDEFVDEKGERERVDKSSSSGGGGNGKWDWVREDKVEGLLKIKEIEGSKIRGAGGASRVEDGSHARG